MRCIILKFICIFDLSIKINSFIVKLCIHFCMCTLNTINFRYGWVNKSILSAFMNWRRRSSLWIRKKKTSFCTYVGLANCFEAKIKSKKYARRSIIIERRCFSCVCTVHLICRNYDCMHIESRHLLHAMLCI